MIACLKDLRRFLRTEDGSFDRPVFFAFGQWSVLSAHLLPLLGIPDLDPMVRLSICIIFLLMVNS
jgi:hypothetical protein